MTSIPSRRPLPYGLPLPGRDLAAAAERRFLCTVRVRHGPSDRTGRTLAVEVDALTLDAAGRRACQAAARHAGTAMVWVVCCTPL
ncbi:hypothetical protein FDP22_09855 [Paroceanicella profunda]|uniref:Uncharacterized protein n=1 Tax=Paroceanicella profunda TaxID=2579971 RepID=A0A5B8G0W7_9RHOB|nr:hypothetical protein [Paroceanicella profunda]QDL92053.1 hypothetical protein FDP22_09855 [Paroceanicella profunda]